MIVIQDQDEIIWGGSDFIEQICQNGFNWRWLKLRSLERVQHSFSNIPHNLLQGSDKVRQKTCRIVIPFIQRQPCGWSLASADPFTDQCCFTEASRSRDKGYARCILQPPVQSLDQARSENNIRPRRGDVKFSG